MQPATLDIGIILHAEVDAGIDPNTYLLSGLHEAISSQVAVHGGDLLQGDRHEWTIGFDNAVSSVKCAVAIQKDINYSGPSPLKISVHEEEVGAQFSGIVSGESRSISAAGAASSVLISAAIEEKISDDPELETLEAGMVAAGNGESVLLYALINEGLTIPQIQDIRGIGKPINNTKVFASPAQRNLVIAGLALCCVVIGLFFLVGV